MFKPSEDANFVGGVPGSEEAGLRITKTGSPFDDQWIRSDQTGMHTSHGTKVAGSLKASSDTDRVLNVPGVYASFDGDTSAAERLGQSADCTTIQIHGFKQLVDERSAQELAFKDSVQVLLGNRSLYDLTGQGFGHRPVTSIACKLASEQLEGGINAQVSRIAPGRALPRRGIAGHVVNLEEPAQATTKAYTSRYLLGGTGGNVLGPYCDAGFRRVLENSHNPGLHISTPIGPASIEHLVGNKGYQRAAATFIEWDAISKGVAEINGFTGKPIYDLVFLDDLKYNVRQTSSGTEVVAHNETTFHAFLVKHGFKVALFNQLRRFSGVAGQIRQYLKDSGLEGDPTRLGAFGVGFSALDRTWLEQSGIVHGAFVGCKRLAAWQEESDPDPEAGKSD
ncbi:MAG: hypothetical protein M1335_02135, partial [Chloroflexi bacterium]|nr:hypothetical protein [Chloroflexota bacterium]